MLVVGGIVFRVPFLAKTDGKDQLQALFTELLHNERERKAAEEGRASQPGEPGSLVGAEAEAGQIQYQLQSQLQPFPRP